MARAFVLVILAVLVAIQFVPYGRDHSNPPGRVEPPWDTPTTRALAVRACFDCHSNETQWPWYSHVAPVSWLLQRDVAEGRSELNFSEWDRRQKEAGKLPREVRTGQMPPLYYSWPGTAAHLADGERATLVAGLERTLARAGITPRERERERGKRHD